MNKLFVSIFVFFVLIGALGFWYWERNQYSKDILKLEILGPEVAQAGDKVEYLVKFKNNGQVRLENAELIFQTPPHSILEDSSTNRITKKIEDIYPGQEQTQRFLVRLFGKEGETLSSEVSLSYQPKNLKAPYESQTTFTTKIEFVPFTLDFDLPLKAENGEEIEFSLNYFSNIDYLFDNLRIKIEYPDGFEFQKASPAGIEKSDWDVLNLEKADGGRIKIKGKVGGEKGSQKIFKAQVGMVRDNEFWVLKETARSLEVVEPSFYISQLVNGTLNYVAKAGDLLHYEIFFKNIGSKPIQNKFMLVKLEGDYFDFPGLKTEDGEHGSGDNTIIWDWKNISSLRFLDAGDEGKIEFWIKVAENVDVSKKITNPLLKTIVSLGGVERVFDLKVDSKFELSQKVYFEEEFFGNSGPLPPELGKATTYTVVWQVKNFWNKAKDVKVKAKLPFSVRPSGKIFPEDTKFTFDSVSREVIWNIGDLETFQGFEGVPLTMAFQIEFIPDSSQKGSTPNLVGESEVFGEDEWTGERISAKAGAVSASLPDDSANQGKGTVQ